MRRALRIAALAVALGIAVMGARADMVDDCNQDADVDRAIRGCTQLINAKRHTSQAYNNRGLSYQAKGDPDRAMADFNRAIEINPKNARAHVSRGGAYWRKGDPDRAIADFNRAIEVDPKYAGAYNYRGLAYLAKGDPDRAIADFNRAIEFDPKHDDAYRSRGDVYLGKGDFDRAKADYARALQLDPKSSSALLGRGRLHLRQGDVDRAIGDLSEAMRLDPKDPEAVAERAAAYEGKGQMERAVLDYRTALELPARAPPEREAHEVARRRLAAIESRARPTAPPPTVVAAAPPGRRVALVIGNANYSNVGRLANPASDGRAIAASLRRLGFAEVIEHYDLGQVAMTRALQEFGDKAAGAEWAVVYYAGHGIEVAGAGFLIPVDARLARDTHVDDEALPLSRVLDKVSSAQKLRLVIVDACRNNPFVPRMVRTVASRSIGRGLALIEPEGGVLVAYAAKHGTTADDGDGANSPFAEALLAHLEEPGLEINFLFRKVRDRVLNATAKRQEPYLYGSLPSEALYFRRAEAR